MEFPKNEIRCRVNPGRDFKLTGYVTGDDTEKQRSVSQDQGLILSRYAAPGYTFQVQRQTFADLSLKRGLPTLVFRSMP